MSDPRTPLAVASRELPAEEAQREERHQLLATLLGAFADGELPAETASQIDAHLLGCPRCRRELVTQRSLRLRLEQEPLTPAPTAFRDRVLAAVATAPVSQWGTVAAAAASPVEIAAPTVEPNILRRLNRATVAVGVVAAVALSVLGGQWVIGRTATPRASVVLPASVPLFARARRLSTGHRLGNCVDTHSTSS